MKSFEKHLSRYYYHVKPFIPRSVQLALRRRVALKKRTRYPHLWPVNEDAGTAPKGWNGWPEGKRFALVLTHDVDTARGQDRCLQLSALEENLGFRSSFNFVAEDYEVSAELRKELTSRGFEVGVHGITHKGNPFRSRRVFEEQAVKINKYLEEWAAVGFRCPCMYHNLDWVGELQIKYDASTFDTDPFEPQSDGVATIYPFHVRGSGGGYVELPYTLPQDHTLFVIMGEKDIEIWKTKLDWIVRKGGMALVNVHPDYLDFGRRKAKVGEYPAERYLEFLTHVKSRYGGQYWHVLPKEMASFWVRAQPIQEHDPAHA